MKTDALFFPELSLSSYEPTLARDLAMNRDDNRLSSFQSLSDQHSITIGVGIPSRSVEGTKISMAIFQPEVAMCLYSKQILHEDELPYFVAGSEEVLINVAGTHLAPGICYESMFESHVRRAADNGANIYISSVMKSKRGIDEAMQHFPVMARKYDLTVLLVNGVGVADDFVAEGCSAAWNSHGELIGTLGTDQGILVYDSITNLIESTGI